MNHTIEIGTVNTLTVNRKTDPGLFLQAADESDVLLPNQYVTKVMEIGTLLDVFVYTDSEDRLVATTQQPHAMLNEFGFFEVVDTAPFGAFVDWGLPKDLFVPRTKQKTPFKVGEKRLLHIDLDAQTHRLIGVEKIQSYLQQAPQTLKQNDPVSVMVFALTPLGYKVIVNHAYEGLIYKNEVFEPIKTGDVRRAYIKQRRSDGKLDISLQRSGNNGDDDIDKVLSRLKENRGMLPYNFKSDANDISRIFHLSKKRFKRTLTTLQDAGRIEVKETGIYIKE